MNKKIVSCSALIIALSILSGCGKKKTNDEYEGGRLVLNLRNLYFEQWDGSDGYTDVINEKFGVKIKPGSYSYQNWGEVVSSDVNANNLDDVFHFDLESFNFGNTYLRWIRGKTIKALPGDLSRWPKIKHLIENTSNVNALKVDGKIYGIPLAYDQNDPGKDFSSFTYVYRRDWVKDIDKAHYHADTATYDAGYPLFREDDVYTFDEFKRIINEFSTRPGVIGGNEAAIGDVAWGFPSLTNFFKDSPHCYSVDSSGKVRNAFTTEGYIKGLKLTEELTRGHKYYDQFSNTNNTKVYDEFKAGRLGIYYENLSLGNYSKLRKDIREIKPTITDDGLNDFTAIMKVKGEDGKYHLEGSENWFSMTFFNYDISDTKMEKILDIMNYLLDEEGTKLAVYGKENYDYIMNDGEVELIEDNWPKRSDGQYAAKINGAKYLREMVTLNYDTSSFDPFTDQESFQILNKWTNDMKQAKQNNQLVCFGEPGNIKWLSTPLKDANTSSLIKQGNDNALKFCYRKEGFETPEKYIASLSNADWNNTINEINKALGK